MDNQKFNALMKIRMPLIGCILEFLTPKETSNLNKHIKNKKIFKLSTKTRFNSEQLSKINDLVCENQFEVGFGIIIFIQLKIFNRDMIAVAGLSGGLEFINFITNERSGEIKLHDDTINSIVEYMHEGNNVLVTASYDHKIKFLDLKTRKDIGRDFICDFIVYFLKIVNFENTQYLLTSTFQKYHIRNIDTMTPLFSVKLHGNYIYKVIHTKALNSDFFLTCSYDNTVKLSNYKTSQVISEIYAHKSAVWGLAYLKHYNKEMCASGSWDFKIKIWNFVKNELIAEINCDPGNAKHIKQFPFLKGKMIVLSYGSRIGFYNIKKKQIVYECEPHTTDIYWFSAIKHNDNNFTLVTSSIDRRIKFHRILPL